MVSSAYCEPAMRRGGLWPTDGRSTPVGGAEAVPTPMASISAPSGSANRAKRAGESGQPWRTPREGRKATWCSPESINLE